MVVDKDALETKDAVEISDLLADLTAYSVIIVSQEVVSLIDMSQFSFRNLGAGLTLSLINRRRGRFPLNRILQKTCCLH